MKYRSVFSIFLTIILISNMGILALAPRPVQASVKSTAASFTGCYTGGVLSQYLSDKIKQGVQALAKTAVEHIKNKLIGGLVQGFLGGIIDLNVPTKDSNAPAAIDAMFTAQEQDRIIARCLAREIQNGMINNIMQVARTSGRDGGPTYIKNWNSFETNAQYRGENIFRAELSTAKLCDYLATDVKKSYGVDPKTKIPLGGQNTRTDSLQPFSLATQCTMPAGFTPQKYQQDFAGNGGWDTFARLLEPQNNIYGLTMLSQDEIQKQRALAVSTDTNQALANNGYLGISGNGKADSCAIKGAAGQCLFYKDIKTPGSYLATSVGATVGAEFAWLTTAQGLNNIIANATDVMLNRLLDLGNPDEGQYTQANDSGGPVILTLPTDTTPTTPGTPTTPNVPGIPPTVPNPLPPPVSSVDLNTATIVGGSPADIANWQQTATITNVTVPPNGAISVDFDKKDSWPLQSSSRTTGPGTNDANYQYTIWLFENIGGQWYGTGVIQMWKGRPDTGAFAAPAFDLYSQLQQNWVYFASPMSDHQLQSGEQVGFMVTAGDERQGAFTTLKERSNIFLTTLP